MSLEKPNNKRSCRGCGAAEPEHEANCSLKPENNAEAEPLTTATYEEFLNIQRHFPHLDTISGAMAPKAENKKTPEYFSPDDLDDKKELFRHSSISGYELEAPPLIERDEQLNKLLFEIAHWLNFTKFDIEGNIRKSEQTCYKTEQTETKLRELTRDFNEIAGISTIRYGNQIFGVYDFDTEESIRVRRDLQESFPDIVFLKEKTRRGDEAPPVQFYRKHEAVKLSSLNKFMENIADLISSMTQDNESIAESGYKKRNQIEQAKLVVKSIGDICEQFKDYNFNPKSETTSIAVVDRRVWRHRNESREKEPEQTVDVKIDYSLMTSAEREALPESLRNLETLSFKKGGITTIVGINGSGKSTLMRALELAFLYYKNPDCSHFKIKTAMADSEGGNLAPFIVSLARAIDIDGFDFENERCVSLDMARGIQKYVQRAHHAGARAQNPIMALAAEQRVGRRSTGELQEEMLEGAREQFGLESFQGLLIIDEPEKGLDPWKLRDMKNRIKKLAPLATIFVVTHNPLMVFDGELERLDLRYPDKGVHLNAEEAIDVDTGTHKYE